jgi:hypothetical protein
MGDLGGEKVCNEANLNLCVHRSLKKGGNRTKQPRLGHPNLLHCVMKELQKIAPSLR